MGGTEVDGGSADVEKVLNIVSHDVIGGESHRSSNQISRLFHSQPLRFASTRSALKRRHYGLIMRRLSGQMTTLVLADEF